MSGLLAGKVWQSALAPHLKPLAATLADIADDDGSNIYPTFEYVAWRLGSSVRKVQRGMEALLSEDLQVLELVTPAGHYRSAEYRLIEDRLPKRPKWAKPIGGKARGQGRHRVTHEKSLKGDTVSPMNSTPMGDISNTPRVTPQTSMGDTASSSRVTDRADSAPVSLNDPSVHPLIDPSVQTQGAADASLFALDGSEPNQKTVLRVRFDRVCEGYPRVEKKKRCWKLFQKLNPSDGIVDVIVADIERKKRTVWGGVKPRYIPNLDKYLEDERWADEVSEIAPYSAEELAQARSVMTRRYLGRCPHQPACDSIDACLKNIAARSRREHRRSA